MKNNLILDFHLFDGEGGMGDPGTASTQSEPKQDIKKVEYGKSSEGKGQTPSQVGSDGDSQGSSLESEWAALVGKGGQFHDLYGQAVSSAIQDRFKNQANLQAQVDEYDDILSPMYQKYGLKAGDKEGLRNAIENDDAYYQAAAEKAGLDIDTYKEMQRLKADADRSRRIAENYELEQRKQETFQRWESEAAGVQEAFPGFDLGLEIQHNPEFAELLDRGADVMSAFVQTHLNEILSGQAAHARAAATQDVVNAIQQRASRPIESSVSNTAAVVQRKTDPSSLTDSDMDEIIRRAENGETFAF